MTFDQWWETLPSPSLPNYDDRIDRTLAKSAWNAALDEAARHFDGYTWGPFKSPAITIREIKDRSLPQSESEAK